MLTTLTRAMMRSSLLWLALFAGLEYPAKSHAGIWISPTDVTDTFGSRGRKPFTLLLDPQTGQPLTVPLDVVFHGRGPTTVRRDSVEDAFLQDGRDTINTEIVDFHLRGTVFGFTAEIIAGLGQGFSGFAPLTEPTRGQIQDLATAPQDGRIDFPADSFFDVFFDVWVDFNGDGIVDVGEVFSNNVLDIDNYALRMRNALLPAVPPPVGTQYFGVSKIDENDPEIGTFQADEFPLPLELFRIDTFRQSLALDQGLVFALGGANGPIIHEVIPEPSGLAVWGLLATLGISVGCWRRKAARREHD